MNTMLVDRYGRRATSLRISVTDRCNFRCSYCMPEEGMVWMEKSSLLTFSEISRLVSIFSSMGVHSLRLTGGEPLMRKELWKLIALLRGIPNIRDIAITTNAFFLKEQASSLAKAGLNRVNVSLDSLDRQTFSEMTRRDYLGEVWEGINEAERVGLAPIKLNVVVIRGVNDHEILRFADLARSGRFTIRFIEFMPIGKDDGWSSEKVVPIAEIIRTIRTRGNLVPVEDVHSPARRFRFVEGGGEIGCIGSVTEPFCASCDRIRLTSDGKLRTCLFAREEVDLRALSRNGATDELLARAIETGVLRKDEGHLINRPGFIRPERTMSAIGG